MPGKKEILRVLPLVLSAGPEASDGACSSVDTLHPEDSDVGFGETALCIGFSWLFDWSTDAGTTVGVLQQMVQILVLGSFTKVQNSHIHSKVGAAGGGPKGPCSSTSSWDWTSSLLMIRSISGSTGSGLVALDFGESFSVFNGLVVQKSLALSSTDDCCANFSRILAWTSALVPDSDSDSGDPINKRSPLDRPVDVAVDTLAAEVRSFGPDLFIDPPRLSRRPALVARWLPRPNPCSLSSSVEFRMLRLDAIDRAALSRLSLRNER